MPVISIANQKGGVGKTTSVHNLGAALACNHKKRVLLVDLDSQGNLTDSCGQDPNVLSASIYEVLDGKIAPQEAIVSLEKNFDLLPANQNLAGAELNFGSKIGREGLLKRAIQKISNPYDFVLIDCPPSLSLLTVNAFVASNYALVPIQAEYHALAGLAQLTNTLKEIKDSELNPNLQILGMFVTFYDSRKKLNMNVADALLEEWGSALFTTKIRDNVALAEAPSHSKDIFTYRPKCFGSEDYKLLAKEVLKKLKKEQ